MADRRVAIIGGGVMAEAILRAWLDAGLAQAERVRIAEVIPARREYLATLGVEPTPAGSLAVPGAEVVLLAVKPHIVPVALTEARAALAPNQLLISIAAGVTLETLEALAPEGQPIIRVMPNTPAQVRAGAAAYARGSGATEEHAALAGELLGALGRCVQVPESLMDAVTGLSGSGPAYLCLVIEALADGGVKAGLPRDIALMLAAQTALGTAELLLKTGDHPAVWKDRVATPGGTTIAGLAALERGGLRAALIDAVEAASNRSRELSGGH